MGFWWRSAAPIRTRDGGGGVVVLEVSVKTTRVDFTSTSNLSILLLVQ